MIVPTTIIANVVCSTDLEIALCSYFMMINKVFTCFLFCIAYLKYRV